MKSENTFCYYLVSDVSNIIGISEIFQEKEFSNVRKGTLYNKRQRREIAKWL